MRRGALPDLRDAAVPELRGAAGHDLRVICSKRRRIERPADERSGT
jgi:hypothetical protein